jgi:tight adherence protein B
MTVATFLLMSATCAAAAAYIVVEFTGSVWLGLGIGALASTVPTSVLRFQRTRRILKFEEQFPEALALISRALKAGHTFTTGLSMVAEEMPAPIGPEFKLLYDQQNYGMPLPDALKEFARRVWLLDATVLCDGGSHPARVWRQPVGDPRQHRERHSRFAFASNDRFA